jgi:hypothetical protein
VATVAPLAQMVALEMGMQELRALLLVQDDPDEDPATASAAPLLPEPSAAAPTPAAVLPAPAETAAATAAAADPAAASSEQQEQRPPVEPKQQEQQPPVEPEQQEQQKDSGEQQRQQRQRPPLQPDNSRAWAVLYEECSTEDERIALVREAIADRPRLTAAQWAVDIGKSGTRSRDLLRAARKPVKELAPAG